MEKILSFSILKEKIIKTDELLAVVLEKNKNLEKSQKWSQHLKVRLEFAKNEVKKLKLRSETLAYNLTSVEKSYESLKNEHEQLKEKFCKLETESGDVINKLQVNYQLANKNLEDCQHKLCELNTAKENTTFVSNDVTQSKRKPAVKKKSPVKRKNEDINDNLVHKKIGELKAEKEKLISEKADLKLEVYELKKKISAMQFMTDKESECTKITEELAQVKSKFKASIESKDKEIERLSNEIKAVKKQRDEMLAENERLKFKNFSLPDLTCREDDQQSCEQIKLNNMIQRKNKEMLSEGGAPSLPDTLEETNLEVHTTIQPTDSEIQKLSKTVRNLETENKNLQTENEKLKAVFTLEDSNKQNTEELKRQIIELKNKLDVTTKTKDKEIKRLSKTIMNIGTEKKNLQCENERLKDENCSYQLEIAVAQQRFTEDDSTLLKKQEVAEKRDEHYRENSKSPTDEEIAKIMGEMKVPQRISPIQSPFTHVHQDEIVNENHKYVNVDLQTIVNRRRNLIKKRLQIAKKKRRKIDLYESLLALKRANINFIISNDSLLSPGQNPSNLKKTYSNSFKIKHRPKVVTVSKELSCKLPCCTNSYMILKSDGRDAPLLGFVGVKNEKTIQKDTISSRDFRFYAPTNTQKYKKQAISCDQPVAQEVACLDMDENITEQSSESILENESDTNCSNNVEVSARENENDEGYLSYPSASSSPKSIVNAESDGQCKIKRNKRRSRSLLSVIKKRKVSAVNKLTLDEYVAPSADDVNITEKSGGCPKNQQKTISDESSNSGNNKVDESIFKKPVSTPKSPKTKFKRPVCSIRRSQRLISKEHNEVEMQIEKKEEEKPEQAPLETPQSPTPESEPNLREKPVIIPLEKAPEKLEKMPNSKIEMLFNKLIVYSKEEEALNEVVKEFMFQKPEYIAEAILERVALDYTDRADTKYSPAPLMTDVQRTMLGFMSKLEKSNIIGVFDSYLTLAEHRLLTGKNLQEFEPITRLYLAICKLQKNLTRMRKLCCDVFYFCEDLAVPFFFTVLTSWTEVLPHEVNSKEFPIARTLVQAVYMKDCNKPGYNLMPLRDLLIKFYGYPTERWDYNEFFKELFDKYLKNPARSSDFALLLYCRNRPEKWVYEKIEEHLKPLIDLKIQDNFKATLIILISNLYNRFSSKSEVNYLPKIREWLNSLVNEETPDVIKRCVYLSLIRLKKK